MDAAEVKDMLDVAGHIKVGDTWQLELECSSSAGQLGTVLLYQQ